MKICSKCKVNKQLSEFHRDKMGILGVRSDCKLCVISRIKISYHERTSAIAKYQKAYKPKRRLNKFGLTEEAYKTLLDACNNSCQICFIKFVETPHIDHNHKTSKIRGLLCSKCNTGIGMLQDSVANLTSAIRYLSR